MEAMARPQVDWGQDHPRMWVFPGLDRRSWSGRCPPGRDERRLGRWRALDFSSLSSAIHTASNFLRAAFGRWKKPISARVFRQSSGPTYRRRSPNLSLSGPGSPKLRTAAKRYGFLSGWFASVIRL